MTMAALRRTHPQIHLTTTLLRRYNTTLTKPTHHNHHSNNHLYLQPTNLTRSFINKNPPNNPKYAEADLSSLRRDYENQVKVIRKQYIYELELQREEKAVEDEVRKLEVVRARAERMKSKEAAALARAAERKAFEEDFCLTMMKERMEKLELWRMRRKTVEERKNSERGLIRSQSSTWIDETRLEDNLLEAFVEKRQF